MDLDFMLVAGTRPNFVKLAPLYRALAARKGPRLMITHTGQHYDHAMSGSFFEELGVPEPEVNLEVGTGSHAQQTAGIMVRFERLLDSHTPRWVVVFGDVNSTIACALVAAKAGVPIAHVEAGLRSGDWTMPEEINRVLTDRLSDRLYAPSRDACENLVHEGISTERVRLVGNIMVDTLRAQLPTIDHATLLREYEIKARHYVLVTLHRPSNVDHPDTLRQLWTAMQEAGRREPVLFPAHPRTQSRAVEFELPPATAGFRLLGPLPYRTFLGLMANARVVVTDSGGVQEETTALGVPCVTARLNTERPITVIEGTNRLVRPHASSLLEALAQADGRRGRIPELWDGQTAERIAADLLEASSGA